VYGICTCQSNCRLHHVLKSGAAQARPQKWCTAFTQPAVCRSGLSLLGVAAAWLIGNSAGNDTAWTQKDELRNSNADHGCVLRCEAEVGCCEEFKTPEQLFFSLRFP
jgi:hypothetical protein